MAEPDKKRILLVEDDPTISDLVAYNLRRAGYEVLQEHNGRAGLETALTQSVDLVLMDLMLPGLDGMTASREIVRRKPSLPIIMLTARSERETMLEGFESGPTTTSPSRSTSTCCSPASRPACGAPRPASPDLGSTEAGSLPQQPAAARRAAPSAPATSSSTATPTHPAPRGEVALNPKEYDLLELLLSRPGHLFPREEIVERVWHQRYSPASRSLDVHVRRLRAKLEEIGAEVELQTVRGVGYRLTPVTGPTSSPAP